MPQCGQCRAVHSTPLAGELGQGAPPPEVPPSPPEGGGNAALPSSLSVSNSAQELADALLALGPSLSPAHVAAAWEHLARRRRRPGFRAAAAVVLPLLGRLALQELQHFSPDQLGSVAR